MDDIEKLKIIQKKLGIKIVKSYDHAYSNTFQIMNNRIIGLSLFSVKIKSFKIFTELTDLRSLTFNKCNLIFIDFLNAAKDLEYLDLSDNKIFDLTPIKNLKNLKILNLNTNQISDIQVLKNIKSLEELDLFNNEISDISSLRNLSNLTTLNLSYNEIYNIDPISSLSSLINLDLNHNKVYDIEGLHILNNLVKVDLSENRINHIPNKIYKMKTSIQWGPTSKRGLFIGLNPIEPPPFEIQIKGNKSIQAYLEAIVHGRKTLNEVKVLLVGDGGSGKTSLVKRMIKVGFNEEEAQTDGINIDKIELTWKKNNIMAHLWDFGGQEIMHATHQFFLSRRSLYILVLDGRKDEKPEYWLKMIQSFGGDSPIFIIINKIDENPGFDVNRNFLKNKYPSIKGFYRISCKDNIGIEEFKYDLAEELSNIKHTKTIWASNWFNIKTKLETMKESFISYEKYIAMCGKEKISENISQETLIEFLHDLGIILHFEDLNLKDTYVLEPRWVTESVYRIINSEILAEANGILNLSILKEILAKRNEGDFDYPLDKHPYIINLMKKFELCFQLDESKVLIPDLLEIQEPNFEFDDNSSLNFYFEYDYLPKSIMPRLIVRLHKDILSNLRWRSGFVLYYEKTKSKAIIKADVNDKRIYISVNGNQKRDYFSYIRHTIRDINSSFKNLKVNEWIPISDDQNTTIEYQELVGLEQMGEETIKIGKTRKEYFVKNLLAGIENPEDRDKFSNPRGTPVYESDPKRKEFINTRTLFLKKISKIASIIILILGVIWTSIQIFESNTFKNIFYSGQINEIIIPEQKSGYYYFILPAPKGKLKFEFGDNIDAFKRINIKFYGFEDTNAAIVSGLSWKFENFYKISDKTTTFQSKLDEKVIYYSGTLTNTIPITNMSPILLITLRWDENNVLPLNEIKIYKDE